MCEETKMTTAQYSPMQLAIRDAKVGVDAGDGGPFGACIVRGSEIISVAHNTVIRDGDPTCHAEMNAIRMASRYLKSHDLSGCQIYTTAAPCPMCLGGIYWARLSYIYVGVDVDVARSFGFDDEAFYKEFAAPPEARSIGSQTGLHESDIKALFEHWQSLDRPIY